MTQSTLAYHEAANIFPLMPDDALQSLADDIRRNGLLMPIETCDGKIIDGRNRSAACKLAGVDPDVVAVDPSDPVAYVLTLNLHRRHLDETQRAMVAGRAKSWYEQQQKDKEKQRKSKTTMENLPQSNGTARDKAGESVGVSGRSVEHAAKVIANGSKKLVDACDQGKVSVSAAAKLADLPKSKQNEVIDSAKDSAKPLKKIVAQAAKHVVPQTDAEWTTSEIVRRKACEDGKTVVANKKTDKQLIRWAIETGCFMPVDRGSIWGNPFYIPEDGDRDEVCESHVVYFGLKRGLKAKLSSLKGKVLGCWCAPERCHADHLASLANGSKATS